jgi:RNA polymerase sigma-70 factor (ECF subfamily)
MQRTWTRLSDSCIDTTQNAPKIAAEQTLVSAMVEGNARAWREFNARYGRLIRSCIIKVVGRSAGEDDIREVFARLLMQLVANDMHKLRMFDADRGARFSSFLGLLAVHCAHDYLRMTRRDRQDRAPLSEAEALPCELPSPHEHMENKERAALLASILEAFPAKDREFVALYFGEALAPEEIAERMRISVKTVYSKRHKIQSRLSAILSEARLAA